MIGTKTGETQEGEEAEPGQDRGPELEEEGQAQGQEDDQGQDQIEGTDRIPGIRMKNLRVVQRTKEKAQEDGLGLDPIEGTDLIPGIPMKSLKVAQRAIISQLVAPRIKIKEADPSQVQDLSQDLDLVTKRFICEKLEFNVCLCQNCKFGVYICFYI